MEIWNLGVARPRGAAADARRLEEAGWSGAALVDSQNLSGDVYVALALAAEATDRIGLSPGVTNPATRQAATTAGAIASVQRIANGRAVMAIGRGDSALAHLGRSPARLASFERYVHNLKRYLAGESVPFADIEMSEETAPPLVELGLAGAPQSSRIAWIGDVPRVPLEVAATGPRVIGIAARHADRIMFSLGAEPERLAWGIEVARKARRDAGLDPDAISYGAYVNAACHPSIDASREIVRGGVTTHARFSVMHGQVAGPVSASERQVLDAVHDHYDMRAHTRSDSPQAAFVTADFIDRFAIVGTPDHCVARFQELAALGLSKFVLSGVGARDADGAVARSLFESQVLPALVRDGGRSAAPAP
jgi:5,10-methylenetetrahydromethanopterin reductase